MKVKMMVAGDVGHEQPGCQKLLNLAAYLGLELFAQTAAAPEEPSRLHRLSGQVAAAVDEVADMLAGHGRLPLTQDQVQTDAEPGPHRR